MAHALTRRSFLAGTAGTIAAAATARYLGFEPWSEARAAHCTQGRNVPWRTH